MFVSDPSLPGAPSTFKPSNPELMGTLPSGQVEGFVVPEVPGAAPIAKGNIMNTGDTLAVTEFRGESPLTGGTGYKTITITKNTELFMNFLQLLSLLFPSSHVCPE